MNQELQFRALNSGTYGDFSACISRENHQAYTTPQRERGRVTKTTIPFRLKVLTINNQVVKDLPTAPQMCAPRGLAMWPAKNLPIRG